MTNDRNLRRERGSDDGESALQTRASTIVKAADHGTPLELSNITIRYGGGKGGADAVSVVEEDAVSVVPIEDPALAPLEAFLEAILRARGSAQGLHLS